MKMKSGNHLNFFLIAGYFHSDKHPGPCEACACHPVGAVGQECAADTGQCVCTNVSIAGRKCDQCQDLYFGFNPIMGRLVPSNYLPLQQDKNSTDEAKCLHTPRLKIPSSVQSQLQTFLVNIHFFWQVCQTCHQVSNYFVHVLGHLEDCRNCCNDL